MTMPEKIWVRSVGNGNGGLYSTVDRSDAGPCVKFIRADIVEKLVSALEDFQECDCKRHNCATCAWFSDAEEALTAYREASK